MGTGLNCTGNYNMCISNCIKVFWHKFSIAFYHAGILPVITVTPDSTGVVYEPGRELVIMCEARDTFGGSVEWTSQGEPVLSIGTWSDVSLV